MWVLLYIKYSKFWSILLEHFIERKPLISEEWVVRYNLLISILYNMVFKIVRVAQMDPKWCRSPKKVTLNTRTAFLGHGRNIRSHFLFIAYSWRQIELLHDLFYHFCLLRFFLSSKEFLIHFQDNESLVICQKVGCVLFDKNPSDQNLYYQKIMKLIMT